MIDIVPEGSSFRVYWKENGKHIGDFERDVDGYYSWWPEKPSRGSWPANALRSLADKLNELNYDWHQQVLNDLREAEHNAHAFNDFPDGSF